MTHTLRRWVYLIQIHALRISRVLHFGLSQMVIFLVRFYIHTYLGLGVTNIDIHRMDTSNHVWRRVENIGGATFFLGSNCVAVSSLAAGTQANCIYLLLWCCDGMRLYSARLDDRTISFSLLPTFTEDLQNLSSCIDSWTKTYWAIPQSFRQEPTKYLGGISSEFSRSTVLMEDEEQLVSLWSVLVPKLSFVDYYHIRAVCKGWRVHGNLGVFNPDEMTWLVLDKPETVRDGAHDCGDRFCYLVEFKGDLIAIFRPYDASPIEMFKLDQSNMSWTKVLRLDDAVVFLDNGSATIRSSLEYGCCNRIYLPFVGYNEAEGRKVSVFYDLEDGKYKPGFYVLTEPMNCIWVEPNFNAHL